MHHVSSSLVPLFCRKIRYKRMAPSILLRNEEQVTVSTAATARYGRATTPGPADEIYSNSFAGCVVHDR